MSLVDGNAQQYSLDIIREKCAQYVRVSKSTKKVKKNGYKSFYNCVTIVFDKKAVKAFCNGKLHITGCKSMSSAQECVDRFLAMMEMPSVQYTMDMVASNVSVKLLDKGSALSLEKVQYKLQNSDDGLVKSTRYNPDIYQGLVAKISTGTTIDESSSDRVLSVLVFYTGTMMITGIKDPAELATVFDYMCNVVCRDTTLLAA